MDSSLKVLSKLIVLHLTKDHKSLSSRHVKTPLNSSQTSASSQYFQKPINGWYIKEAKQSLLCFVSGKGFLNFGTSPAVQLAKASLLSVLNCQ